MGKHVSFEYRNHRGEVSLRTIVPDKLEFLYHPGYDYQPGWHLSGYDVDKKARRSFALCNIVLNLRGNKMGATLIQFVYDGPLGVS